MGDPVNESDGGNQAPFKDMLLGEAGSMKKEHDDADEKVQDGDVITLIIDGILSICVSKRVHSLTKENINLTMITYNNSIFSGVTKDNFETPFS
ncbi:hypothetical protein Gohar_010413 [Gossypium harknessii]|uniref:Uncharacterized protein n=1 Tax=Gossypium harknessii TaxID=34285 RepID=A0A7J9GT35_9ROSI|nr:hypothetical protein [Gossypium harknessii]